VIDVRDDAEVARKLNSHGSGHYASAAACGQLVHDDLLPEISPRKLLDRAVRCRYALHGQSSLSLKSSNYRLEI
jgi:hypothetical protein